MIIAIAQIVENWDGIAGRPFLFKTHRRVGPQPSRAIPLQLVNRYFKSALILTQRSIYRGDFALGRLSRSASVVRFARGRIAAT
jgi:hypothetical protein